MHQITSSRQIRLACRQRGPHATAKPQPGAFPRPHPSPAPFTPTEQPAVVQEQLMRGPPALRRSPGLPPRRTCSPQALHLLLTGRPSQSLLRPELRVRDPPTQPRRSSEAPRRSGRPQAPHRWPTRRSSRWPVKRSGAAPLQGGAAAPRRSSAAGPKPPATARDQPVHHFGRAARRAAIVIGTGRPRGPRRPRRTTPRLPRPAPRRRASPGRVNAALPGRVKPRRRQATSIRIPRHRRLSTGDRRSCHAAR